MKRIKIWLAVLLTIAMTVSFSVIEAENTVMLYSEADLKSIANNLSGHYKLANDIVLTEQWSPIGTSAVPFSGVLDGNGHAVYGLNVNERKNYKGFFGYVKNAVIKDLTLEGTVSVRAAVPEFEDVTCSGTGAFAGGAQFTSFTNCVNLCRVSGNQWLGGLVGRAYGCTFTSCVNRGAVDAQSLDFSSSTGTGGIVGVMTGCELFGCANEVSVFGPLNVGGLVGWVYPSVSSGKSLLSSTVAQCMNTGEVSASGIRAGGLIGYAQAYESSRTGVITVDNCFNIGTVFSHSDDSPVGGIAGDAFVSSGTVAFSHCYHAGFADGSASHTICGAADVIISDSFALSNSASFNDAVWRSFAAMQSEDSFSDFDFTNIWQMDGNFPYPTLQSVPTNYTPGVISLTVKSMPYISSYYIGADATPQLGGLTLVARFSNGTTETVTYANETAPLFTIDTPSLIPGVNAVCVSYKNASVYIPLAVYDNFQHHDELEEMGQYLPVYSAENLNAVSLFPDRNYFLMSDIAVDDFEGIASRERPFTGVFLGNFHTVTVNGTALHGLFNACENAKISDLTINGTIQGTEYAGGAAGYASDTDFTRVNSHADITVSTAEGMAYIGGIVGYAENSALSSCRTTGMLTASGGSTGMYAACGGLAGVLSALSNKTSSLSGCASSASLSGHCAGKGAAGGLVGYAISRRGISYITIESSYAAATQSVVAGNTLFSGGLLGTYFIPAARAANGSRLFIQNCFALTDSTVSAPTLFKGGLLGKHAYSASAIENAYYFNLSGEALSAVSSSECYGSLDHVYAPESFVDAAEPDYFEGFDFSSVWRITGEYLYPQLSAVAFDEQLLSPASGTLTVTGSALEGETLTASFDVPARFTWFADEELRAQGKTYTVTDADFGHTLTVQARPYGLVRGTVVSDPVSVTFIACLSSSAYRLGEDMISQIAPQTSVSAFVSALQGLPVAYRVQYAGESLSDDAVIPSRAELVFSDSAGEHTFTLYVRGDLNDDGLSDASDARILRQFLLTGQNAPPLACADFNDDGKIDVKDSVLLKQAQ